MSKLLTVLSRLTDDQKRALTAERITPQLRGDWIHGRRLPTEPQAVIFAGITGIDLIELQAEIAIARSTEAQRPTVERYLKRARGALAMLVYGLGVSAGLAASVGVENARLCIDRRRFRRGEPDRRAAH